MYKLAGYFLLICIAAGPLGAQVIIADFLVNDPAQNTSGVGRTAIAVAANGNFAIAWQDYNEYGIPVPAMPRVAVQIYAPNVTPIGPLNLFNGESRSTAIWDNDYLTGNIDLEFLPGGALLVGVHHEGLYSTINTWVWSWESGIAAVSAGGQVIDLLAGTGVILWQGPLDLIDNGNIRMAMMPNGNFLATYHGPTYNTDYNAVVIQAFDANVNYVGNYFTPHPGDPGPNFHHVLPDIGTNGSIHLVAWQDGRQESSWDITAQFYDNTAPVGNALAVNSGDPAGTWNVWPSVAMNTAGNSVVVWADTRQGLDGEVYGQRYNASGQAVGANFQISAGDGAIIDRPEVAMRTDGSFMVVWTDSATGTSGLQAYRVRARQFDAGGNPASPAVLLPNQDIPSGQANIATNGAYYYCSWLDVRRDNVTSNVYAKVIGNIISAIEPLSEGGLPGEYHLAQNYPNPFNPLTSVEFGIANAEWVRLGVYDLQGRKVRMLVDGNLSAGRFQVQWNGTNDAGQAVASGVYYYRMEVTGSGSASFAQTRKLILLK